MQAGNQAETSQSYQVADVNDVGLKLLERGGQAVDVVGIDEPRSGVAQPRAQGMNPVVRLVPVPLLGELKAADDVRGVGDRGPWRGRKHQDLVSAALQCLDHLGTGDLIPPFYVGRIEVAKNKNLHERPPESGATGPDRPPNAGPLGSSPHRLLLDQDLGQLLGQARHAISLGRTAGTGTRLTRRSGKDALDAGQEHIQVEVAALSDGSHARR